MELVLYHEKQILFAGGELADSCHCVLGVTRGVMKEGLWD